MPQVEPFALKDAPSLIEKVFPAQKISIEAQKEREGKQSQTLTGLGSYWKGRKPLVLVRSIILGALLPQTDNPEKDLDIYEKLMAINDDMFIKREPKFTPTPYRIAQWIDISPAKDYFDMENEDEDLPFSFPIEIEQYPKLSIKWKTGVTPEEKEKIRDQATKNYLDSLTYSQKAAACKRAEQVDQKYLYEDIWTDVNGHLGHLGIIASSHEELVEQLGILRFGKRPEVGDTFCGAGSIPFEAARIGCDVYASDLNPVGCLLAWGAINLVGDKNKIRKQISNKQKQLIRDIDEHITELGIEHNERGDRARSYLYCLETKCPETGWMIPLVPNWIISKVYGIIAVPNYDYNNKCFDIDIRKVKDKKELKDAENGTVKDDSLCYTIDGVEYKTPLRSIRGDYTDNDSIHGKISCNKLRKYEKSDFKPHQDDIYQERLYAIQWIDKYSLNKQKSRDIYLSKPKAEDFVKEKQVDKIVFENINDWQNKGLIPDIEIDPGQNNSQPIWEKGWTHWHHLFNARQLFILSLGKKHGSNLISLFQGLNWNSKLSIWDNSRGFGNVKNTFYNQALNTMSNWGCRSFLDMKHILDIENLKKYQIPLKGKATVYPCQAKNINEECDIFITDPPYGDQVNYHEITEFFTAWVKKNPPEQFKDWVWDTRRPMAIKGKDEDFRKGMVEAYKAMADHMPDNGIQCVMFTHKDASLWSDMASIFWGAGLQVMSAWYIATETNAAYQKGASHVQGTVILMLKKRPEGEHSTFSSELVEDIADEVKEQIETLTGLNQQGKQSGRSENIFEDADLQMAGYAAALRVLTGYTHVDGDDMRSLAMRPRKKNEKTIVDQIVDYAAQIANNMLVPQGLEHKTWENMTGPERFYLKMLDIESTGAKKLDNYQNFAKAFRVGDYQNLMANTSPNKARLKSSKEFKVRELGSGLLGETILGGFIYALKELQEEKEPPQVLDTLKQNVPAYFDRTKTLKNLADYFEEKANGKREAEIGACRVLHGLIHNDKW